MWQGKSFICPKHLHTRIYRSLRALMLLLFIYFGIILLSALHSYKVLPRWKSPQRTTIAFPQDALMLSDLTFSNNCSFLHKMENIKSSLCALGQRPFYAVPRAGCCQPQALWCSSVSSFGNITYIYIPQHLGNQMESPWPGVFGCIITIIIINFVGGFFPLRISCIYTTIRIRE